MEEGDKKDTENQLLTELFIFAVVIFLGARFLPVIVAQIKEYLEIVRSATFFVSFTHGIKLLLQWITFISIVGIVYSLMQLARIQKKRIKEMFTFVPSIEENHAKEEWERLLKMASSDSPHERKTAIIEADVLLNTLVEHMGYTGDTLGEKLRHIEKSDFVTLDDAWRAHKVRNRLAHENSTISKEEALRVMRWYENVFREFEYI